MDGIISTGQGILEHNMYAYCYDNPVNMHDSDGNLPDEKLLENAEKYNEGWDFPLTIGTHPSLDEALLQDVGQNIATSVDDAVVSSVIKKTPSKKLISTTVTKTCIIKTYKPLMSVKALKAVAKTTGVITAVTYAWDIHSDYKNYGGFTEQFAQAAAITTGAMIICVTAGLICTGVGAPAGITLAASIVVGVGTSYGSDAAKRKFIKY